jgi:S-formylglutathione hydrolase FrmB
MGVATIQLQSSGLEHLVTYNLLLPDPARVGPPPYDVLVQLHGKYDDHTSWLYKSNLLEYVKDLPLLVVLPDGRNGYWGNLHPHLRYEDLVVKDLWEHLHAFFPVKPARWAIGGLSMGGYGALRLGLKHPDKFCSIFAHSSVIPAYEELEGEWRKGSLIYETTSAQDLDCFHWAEQLDRAKAPRLSFDCGVDDELIEHNRRFHAHLEKLKLPHGYAEYPGGHTWDYWDRHVQTALRQHCEVLRISPAKV